MNPLIDTFVFFLIYYLSLFSVIGYGILLDNFLFKNEKNYNLFITSIYGYIFLLIISFFIHATISHNSYLNLIIFMIGIIFFIKEKKYIPKSQILVLSLLLLLLFSGLLISKTHEDFNSYHFFSIYEIFNNNIRIGVQYLEVNGNQKWKFIHASLLGFNQALFIFPFFDFKLIHIPVFHIYLITIGYFFNNLFNSENENNKFFSLFIILVLLTKFSRLSEYGYDYVSQFILLIVLSKIIFNYEKLKEIDSLFFLFIFAVLIKPISLLFCPIFFYLFYKSEIKKYIKNLNLKKLTIFLFLIIIIFLNSFIRTGCIYYPVNKTCLTKEVVYWSEKKDLRNYSDDVSLWAKGYFHQDKTDYEQIEEREVFKKNFNWLKYWISLHFFYKIFEFILILVFVYFLLFFNFKEKIKNKNKFDSIFLLFCSLLSVLFWLNTIPQFRFGFSSLIAFSYSFLSIFFLKKFNLDKRKIYIFFIIGFLIFNLRNISRINSEISRDDLYKFKNFPWYNENIIKMNYDKFEIKNNLLYSLIKKIN